MSVCVCVLHDVCLTIYTCNYCGSRFTRLFQGPLKYGFACLVQRHGLLLWVTLVCFKETLILHTVHLCTGANQ